MSDWTTPLLSTLNSSDALALQQIFRSIGQEIARLNKEIADLKRSIDSDSSTQKYRLR